MFWITQTLQILSMQKISIVVRHELRYFKLITLNENYDDSEIFSQGVTTTTKF